MPADEVSEALVAKPLPQMIQNLAMAVVEANAAVRDDPANDTVTAIHSAEIELSLAISMERGSEWKAGVGGSIYGFSPNASYARTFNFKEEAASKIKIQMSVLPKQAPAPA